MSNLLTSNIERMAVVTITIDVASVAANTSAEQDFTVSGLAVGDLVFVNKSSLSAGLVVGNARVKAANTLSLTFGNSTGSGVDPASETYLLAVFRPTSTRTSVVL